MLADKNRIVLFGAGKGAEEFLDFVTNKMPAIRVVAIVDNDLSLAGKALNGITIVPPGSTTISS